MDVLWNALDSAPYAWSFVVAIVVVFAVGASAGILYRYLPAGGAVRFAPLIAYAPSAMTTLGIIGTFFGIFIGLSDFDVADIDASVPALLAGLKTAFATSLVGMGASIAFRIVELGGRSVLGPRPAIVEDDPLAILSQIEQTLDGRLRDQTATIVNGFDKQTRAFETFAEQMKQGATEAIIESLRNVIQDFNAQLNEQFGENFKQLNEAVGHLNDWQQNYQGTIERTQTTLEAQFASFEAIKTSLEETAASVATLAAEARALPDAAASVRDANAAVLDDVGKLATLMETVGALRSDAQETLPRIEESVAAFIKELEAAATATRENIERTTAELSQGVERTTTDMTRQLSGAADEMSRELREIVERQAKGMGESFARFESETEREVGLVLKALADNLTSMSTKFSDDYSRFSDQLARVTRAADIDRAA